MAWNLVLSLVALRNEFNVIAPNRDKGADGAIGDSSHTSASDHSPDEDSIVLRDHDADSKNEVHALDIDSSGPWPVGRSFASIVAAIIAGEKAKWLDADDRCRLKYVIFNRKIYSQTSDFAPRDYSGTDPHTNHAHFSARYDTPAENDTRPWGVIPKEIDVAKLDEDDYARIKNDMFKVLTESRPAYQLTRIADRGWSNVTFKQQLDYLFESLVAGQPYDANEDGTATESASVQQRLTYLEEMIEEIKAAVTAPPEE